MAKPRQKKEETSNRLELDTQILRTLHRMAREKEHLRARLAESGKQ